ncbi:MAG: terminase [Gammaproteobacteria bacterium RIFCSPHIGHO2_12_FULL_63_22]|nr:MAG: terminase [Gammaproteobacteria bacterium RIFCSPHIGHO2_12_FULL_63_22]
MTPKQEAFVREYLIDLNATAAARRAGYSQKNADRIGPELLGKTCVAAAIEKALAKRAERAEIDAAYVLKRLVEIDDMDVLDIMGEDMTLKPISQWPSVWRRYLSGFDVAEMFKGRGDDRQIVGILKKIKWPDKVRNLELLGKHVGVQAFRDQVAQTGTININIGSEDAEL